MNELLRIGQSVVDTGSGLNFHVDEYLGGGSQGEVYRASARNNQVAIKWFYPRYLAQDGRQLERIERAVLIGAPSSSFLWPEGIVKSPEAEGFGYVMALREPRFRGMAELVTRQIEPSFRALTTAGFELANAFLQLHARGLCYRDISFGNVFFDPASGSVQICDNDNVDVDGQPGAIGGTARFMAPELVTGAASPSTHSDLFSLAVLLFYLLMNHHPLEGSREADIRCFDLPAMTLLYGSHPVFVFDPDDASNRPVPGLHDNALAFWPIYPASLRGLFIRAFTAGMQDPQNRVRESEWRSALIELRDSLFQCSACGAENFYDPAALRAADGGMYTDNRCWACGRSLQLPPRIRITRGRDAFVVMLADGAFLYPHHTESGHAYIFDEARAQVRQHPNMPGVLGLTNLSNQPWTAATVSAETITVPPGRSVTLKDGVKIQFGGSEGEVRT
jgi:DNA-binding helix-hairpin-helix protein with protein kinase domain